MTDYLVFRLYGSMAAWGDIAVGEVRPSFTHPSKSAVMGLIAAALGIRRDEEAKHQQLSEGYGFAVRVDDVGVPMSDYHTAQVPPSGTGRNRIQFFTRRDEIFKLPKEKLNTILSKRDYRQDALMTAVLWMRDLSPYSLSELARALQYPHYTLYLGRKSCPLALPVEAQVVSADSVCEALSKANFAKWKRLPGNGQGELYWEEGAESGMQPQHTFVRRDLPISRKRWQFDVRQEHHASLLKEG